MRLSALLIALIGLSACGSSGGDDSGKTSEAGAGMPACSTIWVDGQTLPEGYDGCTNADGSIEAAVTVECDSGIGIFATYQDRFHALLGGEITEAESSSDEYAADYEACMADAD